MFLFLNFEATNIGGKMISAIKDSLKAKSKIVQVGTGTDTVRANQIQMSVLKDKKEDLINKTLQRTNIGLELDSQTLNTSTAKSVEVWVRL
jgi:hypothetical protein